MVYSSRTHGPSCRRESTSRKGKEKKHVLLSRLYKTQASLHTRSKMLFYTYAPYYCVCCICAASVQNCASVSAF